MKNKITYLGISLAVFLLMGTANAQMMYGSYQPGTSGESANTDPAVVAGQQVWNALQSKQTQCSQLANADYENLGEYVMEQMMGSAHEAMDQAVLARSGQAGLDAMHIAMGERFSGCGTNSGYYNGASSTPEQTNFPFFNMMGYGYYGPMAGYGYMGAWGWILMLLFWALVIAGIVALVRWRFGNGRHRLWHDRGGSAMDILKERYAKGEIEKKEFEEKKRDLES